MTDPLNILNADGDPSCGLINVTASPVSGSGTLELTNETDFCLTMGPDAGMLQVTVSTCNQSNGVLLYDYGAPQNTQPGPPASPSNLAAMYLTTTSINLTWQDNSNNELGFQILRSTSSSGPWKVVGKVGAGVTSYTDTGLDSLTTYFYEVAAFN